MTPCLDPGCLGCQDGDVCDYRNPDVRADAVYRRRRLEVSAAARKVERHVRRENSATDA